MALLGKSGTRPLTRSPTRRRTRSSCQIRNRERLEVGAIGFGCASRNRGGGGSPRRVVSQRAGVALAAEAGGGATGGAVPTMWTRDPRAGQRASAELAGVA